jgi:hypothetical protein
VADKAYAEEADHLQPLPAIPYSAVLTVERRVSHEGMVSVDGGLLAHRGASFVVPPSLRRADQRATFFRLSSCRNAFFATDLGIARSIPKRAPEVAGIAVSELLGNFGNA